MLIIRVEGTKDKQIFTVEGTAALREFRATEPQKSVGKKKKWIYHPDKKEAYAKNF